MQLVTIKHTDARKRPYAVETDKLETRSLNLKPTDW